MQRFVFLILLSIPICLPAQRVYAPHSVLASGTWFKIATIEAGVYRVDQAFLNTLGAGSGIPSSSIRLFGNGVRMLPENNAAARPDDLQEVAIMVVDGGDGVFNPGDYFLFYSPGADGWITDTATRTFHHEKNLYTNQLYYYLSIGTAGTGKRLTDGSPFSGAGPEVTSFDEHQFHELDTVNFLASGKEWYGEEFSNSPGHSLTRTFQLSVPAKDPSSPVSILTDAIARSVGASSRFDISINGQIVEQITVPAVTGGQYDPVAAETSASGAATLPDTTLSISVQYIPGSFNSQGWLNWFEIFSRRLLVFAPGHQLSFRDWQSTGNPAIRFRVSNANAAMQVWDVSSPLTPVHMTVNLQGTDARFSASAQSIREYIAFDPGSAFLPVGAGRVLNQDLHGSAAAGLLIVTTPDLAAQAQRIGEFHLSPGGMKYTIATTDQVFNEFSSGIPDPTAIRDFAKMFYDRFGGSPASPSTDRPKYLLLFGDASYDFKSRLKNNTNLVPCFESASSLDPLSTYTSDDFFGFLDDNEDINSSITVNQLDLGIGRVPAKNEGEAKNFVDKELNYVTPESYGPWRNNQLFIADDEDLDLHLQDAEALTATSQATAPVFDITKIYLDAYKQESGPGGGSYPQVNQAINNQVYNGTLIWNYSGHGGASRLAEETIVDRDVVSKWNNPNKLPLFITATCDFAPYDNPLIASLGEDLLLRPKTGGIALLTTTRVVFSFSNRVINNNYLQFALQRDSLGRYRTLGESIRLAKNFTYQSSGDITNNRKFTLLGDPALTLAYPQLNVKTVSINGRPADQSDTLKATSKVVVEGEVTDGNGALLADFNGTVYPTVFDKPQTVSTLGNDPGSPVTNFTARNNFLYRGKASVINGRFSFSFKLPKDINYQYGNGKLSFYANDANTDANGSYTNAIIGGLDTTGSSDHEGPVIKAYLNDQNFVNGSVANENSILIVRLSDSSGINTSGTGIGHDIIATLDNDNRQYYTLNDFFEADLNSYQQGTVRFQLPDLKAGFHSLRIKAWDVLDNSSEYVLDFNIVKNEELVLDHVLNYPNPFTTKTTFWFEHNRPEQNLQVKVQIFTLTGKVVKTIKETINDPGNRSSEVEWDGRDDFGDRIGRGVYLYRLTVITPEGLKKEKIEKLVIL